MAELNFCKQFLTALDSRPVKLSGDHIADARSYPPQSAYILPRLPHPPHPERPTTNPTTSSTSPTASTSSEPTVTITLKPLKSSFPTHTLPALSPSQTSLYDLKSAYAKHSTVSLSKIKLLWRKKPTVDSKTVAETTGSDAGTELEFAVMLLPGATAGTASQVSSPPAVAPSEAEKGLGGAGDGGPAAQGPSGKDVVGKEEFWEDLRGFVVQRIRDEKEGERLVGLFRGAWEKDR